MGGILEKLFGSGEIVRILRLCVSNPEVMLSLDEVTKRSRVKRDTARAELKMLEDIGFVEKKIFSQEVSQDRKNRKTKPKKRKVTGYQLNPDFELLTPLRNLLLNTEPFKDKEVVKRFKGAGNLKVIIVSGVFTHNDDCRVDLLLVGDKLKKGTIESTIRSMESEIGKELEYAIFETDEFKYRLEIYDKLVRDILDFPHRKILDKLGI